MKKISNIQIMSLIALFALIGVAVTVTFLFGNWFVGMLLVFFTAPIFESMNNDRRERKDAAEEARRLNFRREETDHV